MKHGHFYIAWSQHIRNSLAVAKRAISTTLLVLTADVSEIKKTSIYLVQYHRPEPLRLLQLCISARTGSCTPLGASITSSQGSLADCKKWNTDRFNGTHSPRICVQYKYQKQEGKRSMETGTTAVVRLLLLRHQTHARDRKCRCCCSCAIHNHSRSRATG